RDEDYSYFHLLLPSVASGTIFGISCNRQISSDQLLNKGKDVTRSTVQKAIVVLASKPIFGPLRDKLGVITRAFFAQKDFEDKSILVDLYSSLEIPMDPGSVPSGGGGGGGGQEDGEIYMGTSLRELVHKFRFKTLMLLKLIILQRRTMFYAAHTPIESLCTFQYSLVALIPYVDRNMMTAFNDRFIEAFKATPAFELWDRTTDSHVFDLVEPKHPMEGKTNPIEDVGIRLAHGLHDLHLEENLAPTREAISRGLSNGSESLWKTYSFLRSDLGKRQADVLERLGNPDATSALSAAPPVIATTVLAGVDVAKAGAANIATGIGTFLSSSRRSLWARAPTPEPELWVPKVSTRAASPTPSTESRYPPRPISISAPPTPANNPAFPSFFRPLSTSSLATSPSVHPSPPASTTSFFTNLRRTFEPAPTTTTTTTTTSSNSPAPSIRTTSAPHSAPNSEPPSSPSTDAGFKVRDLDKEYAASDQAKRASATTLGSGEG
ncbi:hypothetical protein P7C70_g9027, partial [Phenoliferia sp. Uapishka_3]